MKKTFHVVIGAFCLSALQAQAQSPAAASAAQIQPAQVVSATGQGNQSIPLYSVTMVARTTKAINYGRLSGATRIDFRGTVLMPQARGQARVEGRRGAVKIQAQFDKLAPPSQFGPEYLTYVLWAISPVGRATNLGEVVLQGVKSKVDVTAELQAFALVVTAEPYFAVIQPSDVVVLENVVRPDTAGQIEEVDAKFDLLERGQYAKINADLQPVRMDPGTPLGLYEARNALKIARAARADHYASDTFAKATQFLGQAESYQIHHADKKQVEMTAREAVQTAEDARTITVKRLEEEHLAQERQAAAEREARAKADADEAAKRQAAAEVARAEAEHAKLEAELAAERAARERAEAETAKMALLTQQNSLQAQADQARQAAGIEAQQRAQAEMARASAETARAAALAQQQAALAEADRARQAADQAERARQQAEAARQQAEAEKAELRSRLLNQLSLVLQTRDSVRGLIVNMSDVLFDSGSYTLRPAAREKLAKISGIVMAYPGLNLQIEGHTDSVGGDDFNQQLSQRRAASVRDFLVQQGVQAAAITARGLGKNQPVASNDSLEGRQQNRRVELVVTGDAIGTATVASARTTGQ